MSRGLAEIIAAVAVPLLTLGCGGARVTPPAGPPDPVRAYVADYGRHSSVLIPVGDGRDLHEYAFGDWHWFAEGRTSIGNGLDALFASDGSALGRREVRADVDASDLAVRIGAERLLAFDVPRGRATQLATELDSRYRRRLDTHLYNPHMSLGFVRDDAPYSLWHNCNHMTATWLESLGCAVRGSRITSKFRLAEE